MAIRDFIGNYIQSDQLFDGTYGIEIETESKIGYKYPRFSRNKNGTSVIDLNGNPVSDMAFWEVAPDGSLRDFGAEYILKAPMMYEVLFESLEEFKDKTHKINFIQDSISTSVHVHINMLPETWKTMGNFLTLYTLVENLLIEYSGEFRRNNLFCLPIRSVPYVNKLSVDIFKQVQSKKYNFKNLLYLDNIKYAALNLGCLQRFGSIEVRSHRGVSNIDLIYRWVTILNRLLEFSRRPATPSQMMDAYKLKGKVLLKDIFQDEWKHLKHDDVDSLLKTNLWFAANVGYVMSDEAWNELDKIIIPEKTEKYPYPLRRLNYWSQKLYNKNYLQLSQSYQQVVLMRIEQEDSIKGMNLNGSPQPYIINWPPAAESPTGFIHVDDSVNEIIDSWIDVEEQPE